MFQIAYGAGHYLYTSGRRVSPQFDPYETREWVLNDRVARFFARAAEEYEEVSLLRVGEAVRHGKAVGMDDEGALLVQFENGQVEAVNSGEVSVRGVYGYL